MMGPVALKVLLNKDQVFLPYGKQDISEADIQAVTQVLRSEYLTQGPEVENFENAIKKATGASYAVAVSNGTAALHLTYLALGIKAGDAVFVPAITFAATANAVKYCGATPIFVDVDSKTGILSLPSLEVAIALSQLNGLKPRAVTVVHLAGFPFLTNKLKEICKLHGLYLVEDACHALGAELRLDKESSFQKIGGSICGDATILSFHPVKHITTGEGGAILTSSKELAKKISLLRSHGITKNEGELLNHSLAFDTSNNPNPWYQEMQYLGYHYIMNELSAALGTSQLKRLDHFVESRRLLASYYQTELLNLPYTAFPRADTELTRHSYHLYPLQIDFGLLKKSRAQVINELRAEGIGTQVHYLPVPWHPYYLNSKTNSLSTPLSGAKTYYENTLSIPMYPALLNKGKERIVSALRKVINKNEYT